MPTIYLIGSLRNPEVPLIARYLRKRGFEAYDDWYSPGPEADDRWQAYEKKRGRTFDEALQGWHARQVFEMDKRHLDRCDAGVLILPAGKSGHLELGYVAGQGKPVYILLDKEPERYDCMYGFAKVVPSLRALVRGLKSEMYYPVPF